MINIIVNIYPIMVQRYNRARVDVCTEKLRDDAANAPHLN